VSRHVAEGMTTFDAVNAVMDQSNHIGYVVGMMDPDTWCRGTGGDPQKRLAALRNFDPNSDESRKALQFLKAHNTVIDPTLTVFEMFMRTGNRPFESLEPGVAKVAPALSTQLRNVGPGAAGAELGEARFVVSLKTVQALHRAGIPVVVGTDQTVPGHSVHRQMALKVTADSTPVAAVE